MGEQLSVKDFVRKTFLDLFLTEKSEETIVRFINFKLFEDQYHSGEKNNMLVYANDDTYVDEFMKRFDQLIEKYDPERKRFRLCFVRTTESDIKEEDPEYCQVIDSFEKMKLEFENDPSFFRVIVTTSQSDRDLFDSDERFRYQIMNRSINLDFVDADDMYQRFFRFIDISCETKRYGFEEYTDDFKEGMKAYFREIYPDRAINKNLSFLSDMRRRIIESYGGNFTQSDTASHPPKLDGSNIPFYNKVKAGDVALADSVKDVSVVDEKERADLDEYIKDVYSVIQTMESTDNRTVHVGLFALSKYPGVKKISPTTFLYNGEKLDYFYQLENALLKMKKESKLDYLILLTTEETVKEQGIEKEFDGKKKIYTINCSEEKLVKQIVMKGGLLNEKMGSSIGNRVFSVMIPDPSSGTQVHLSKNNSAVVVKRTFDEEMAVSVSEILKRIKDIRKENGEKKIEVHYYNHGAFRDLPVYLENMMSLLEDDPSIHVCKNVTVSANRQAVISDGGKGVSEFVAGIREFRNYCKIKSLREYYADKALGEKDKKLMAVLSKIAVGMQMSDMDLFLNGVEELSSFGGANLISDPYLKLFYDEIVSAFPFLNLKNTPERYIPIIKWCLENGYYQQTLTMIESRMSSILDACGLFKYPSSFVNKGSIKTEEFLTGHANTLNHVSYRIGTNMQYWKNQTDKMNGNRDFVRSNQPSPQVDHVFIKASENMRAFLVMHTILKNKRNQSNHGFGMNENRGTGNGRNNQTNWNDLICCMVDKYRKLQPSGPDAIRNAVMYYVDNPNDVTKKPVDAEDLEAAITVFVRDMYLGLLEHMIKIQTGNTNVALEVRQEEIQN